MKSTILFVSLAAIISVALAQTQTKVKGEACTNDNECSPFKCVGQYCGCKIGHLPVEESHGSTGTEFVNVCTKVVGYGCNHDTDCATHLPNSKCDSESRVCVCKSEDNCKDGAVTFAVMSMTTLMGIAVAVLKLW